MNLSERRLGGSAGIMLDIEQMERLKELQKLIIVAVRSQLNMSTSDVIAALLDAEQVETGPWKESWEDLPEQLGREMPEDWVPCALGEVKLEDVLGYGWGTREVEGITRARVEELVYEAGLGGIFKVLRGGVIGTQSVRITQKQKARLEILGRKCKARKATDILAYLLDRAGMRYGHQAQPRLQAIEMLERELERINEGRGMMEDIPALLPKQATEHEVGISHADALTEAGELAEHNEM